MSADISIPGGRVIIHWVATSDPDALFNVPRSAEYQFEYSGWIPKDLLLELVRRTRGPDGYMINGVPLVTFLERVNARESG